MYKYRFYSDKKQVFYNLDTAILSSHAEYYVALLSAAAYFGATHQKPARFQVISNKRIKHSLAFGQVVIELIYKDSLSYLPTQDFIVSSGYLKVATPELIAIDLFKYPHRAGRRIKLTTLISCHYFCKCAEIKSSNNLVRLGSACCCEYIA